MQQEQADTVSPIRDPQVWFAAVVTLVTLVLYFVHMKSVEARADYIYLWGDLPLIALVAIAIGFRRPPAASNRERGFWRAWAIGFGCWFFGRLAWGLFYDVGLPIDLVSDFFFMLLYVGLLIGLELDPGGPEPTKFQDRLRRYTTGGGILLLLAIFVYFTLIPMLMRPVTYDSWVPAIIGTVIFDVYVVVRLYGRYKSSRSDYWKRVYSWLGAAFAIWVATDSIDVIATFQPIGLLEEGQPLYLIWYVPCIILVAGAMVSRQPHNRTPAARPHQVTMAGPMGGTPLLVYVFILPLAHVFMHQTGLADQEMRSTREIMLVITTLLMAGYIYRVHQIILWENRRLRRGYEDLSLSLETANRELEDRVQQRTGELEFANLRLAEDISQRAAVERRLRAAEARNHALIQAVPDALILVDYEGVVQDVYSGRTDLDQVDLSSSKGQVLSQLLPAEFQTDVEDALNRISGRVVEEFGPLAVENNSQTQQLEFRFGQCGDDEILVVVQDVTERRAFESSLQQSQKLESLGVMAGGIAHDFNNLLTSILGNAQLAREILTEKTEAKDSLAAIEGCAVRAAKLTNNLLAYAGEAHIEREPMDLVAVFVEMKTLLATAIPKRAHFEFEMGSEPLWIVGNEAQLTQILLNLARNAAEALTDGNDSVRVDMQRCQIPETGLVKQVLGDKPAAGEYVRLRVRDTGCGMVAETQKRIFDPFFTSKGAGRGLGLAAVLGIVSHHNGALTLESTLGKGTEVSVYFPACANPDLQKINAARGQGLRGSGTILVVDDEKEVRDLTSAYLKRRGFAIVQAIDGAEAVKQAHAHQGQLTAIVMDYSMPRLTGVEAFHLIRREDKQVPVILMSGYGQREALRSLEGEPRTGFLKKPFELKELTTLLQQQFGLLTLKGEA